MNKNTTEDTAEIDYELVKAIQNLGHDEVADIVHTVIKRRNKRTDCLMDKMNEIKEVLNNQQKIMEKLFGAFPDDDARGHREAHEVWMEREMQNKELKKAIINKSITAIVFAVLIFVATATWDAIKKDSGL